MGMISTRILADGRRIISEMTRGVTTTQVLSQDGEVLLTRLKSITVKKVPPKVKKVGFFPQEQQKTFITVKKAVSEGETNSYSILDRVYKDGVRIGERRLSSDTACFAGYNSNYVKDIFANEGGQLVHKSETQIKNGVRSLRKNPAHLELKLKKSEIETKLETISKEYHQLRNRLFYSKINLKEAKDATILTKIHIALQKGKYERAYAIACHSKPNIDLLSHETKWLIYNYVYNGGEACARLRTKKPELFSELIGGLEADIKSTLPRIEKLSFQERKQIRSRMGVLAKQRNKLFEEMKNIQNQVKADTRTQCYNDAGLPAGFGHLDRGFLDLNF